MFSRVLHQLLDHFQLYALLAIAILFQLIHRKSDFGNSSHLWIGFYELFEENVVCVVGIFLCFYLFSTDGIGVTMKEHRVVRLDASGLGSTQQIS